MEALRKMIQDLGQGIGADIVKVDMFLNHRIDTRLLFLMGEAWAEEFRAEKPDLVLTVEASGIAMAIAAAHALGDLPVVFAKKSSTVVQNGDTVQAPVYSFTHKRQNMIRIDRRFLPAGSRVLIIDDFLADDQAVRGMMSLCEQKKAEVVGVGIAVIAAAISPGLYVVCRPFFPRIASAISSSDDSVTKTLAISIPPRPRQ